MPGISLSGIQKISTTKLKTMTAWPRVIGTCRMKPECSTSHGARPRSPRTINPSEAPYITRPTYSWVSRSGSRPARSWANGPSSMSSGAGAAAGVAVSVTPPVWPQLAF